MDRLENIKRRSGPDVLPDKWRHPSPADVLWLIDRVERLSGRAAYVERVEDVNRDLIDECKRLNAENERLKEIATAAKLFSNCCWEFGADAPSACSEYLDHLTDAIDANSESAE